MIRTASGPRFVRAGEVTELHEELERIQNSPGLVERAADTVRRAAPRGRSLRHRAVIAVAKLKAKAGSLGALGCVTAAAWQLGTVAGLLGTAVTLVTAEWVVR